MKTTTKTARTSRRQSTDSVEIGKGKRLAERERISLRKMVLQLDKILTITINLKRTFQRWMNNSWKEMKRMELFALTASIQNNLIIFAFISAKGIVKDSSMKNVKIYYLEVILLKESTALIISEITWALGNATIA